MIGVHASWYAVKKKKRAPQEVTGTRAHPSLLRVAYAPESDQIVMLALADHDVVGRSGWSREVDARDDFAAGRSSHDPVELDVGRGCDSNAYAAPPGAPMRRVRNVR